MDFFIIEGFRSISKKFAELRRVTFTGPSRAASFLYIARCVRVIFFRLDSHCRVSLVQLAVPLCQSLLFEPRSTPYLPFTVTLRLLKKFVFRMSGVQPCHQFS